MEAGIGVAGNAVGSECVSGIVVKPAADAVGWTVDLRFTVAGELVQAASARSMTLLARL